MLRSFLRRLPATHTASRRITPIFVPLRHSPNCSYTQSATASKPKSAIVTSLSKNCLSCGSPLPTPLPVCPHCLYIAQLHEAIPYHEIFGLPYDPNPFVVNTSLLKKRFHDAQRVCHPDAWATKDDVSGTKLIFFIPLNQCFFSGQSASSVRFVEYD